MDIPEFLQSKGGVGVIVALMERGKVFTEIEPDVNASSSTLSARLDNAVEIGFVERKSARRHDRTRVEYHLTEMGEELGRKLSREGVVRSYQAMMTQKQNIEDGVDATIDWFESDPSLLLAYPSGMSETMIDRSRTRPETEPGFESKPAPEQEPTGDSSGSDAENDSASEDQDGDDADDDDEKQTRLEFDEDNKPI